ncbi:hypothetical protein AVEN_98376-1 [Araneus ventricosus]|uniref:Uncharacterized protein n=1 Tax=Araneus ventricosus TaxID=182803 RepID=A0A4Y2JJI1_ARAVE|nr:hypothetical protein AVEN_98376-1 [Araneus ventricosus]
MDRTPPHASVPEAITAPEPVGWTWDKGSVWHSIRRSSNYEALMLATRLPSLQLIVFLETIQSSPCGGGCISSSIRAHPNNPTLLINNAGFIICLSGQHDCPVCNSCYDVAISDRTAAYFTRSFSNCYCTQSTAFV